MLPVLVLGKKARESSFFRSLFFSDIPRLISLIEIHGSKEALGSGAGNVCLYMYVRVSVRVCISVYMCVY